MPPLNGYEKAAIFLSTIGEEAAAEVFKGLDVKDIGRITLHMTRMKTIKKYMIDEVMKEVIEMISAGDITVGGERYVRKVLSKGLGEENATKVLEMASKEGPLDSLRWVDSQTLYNFLITEHPQTIALVLSLLEPAQASEVLSELPETLKIDVATRIASTERIPTSAIEDLEDVLKGHLDVNKGKGRRVGGIRTIAEILNQSDRTTEQTIIGNIEKQNSALADSIRQFMFVFEDIMKVDDKGIQMILKEITTEDLSLALKTASEGLKEKIFKNMSHRAAQILKEEMEAKGPVRVSDVERAQQNIVKVARKLEEEGKIVLAGRGSEKLVA